MDLKKNSTENNADVSNQEKKQSPCRRYRSHLTKILRLSRPEILKLSRPEILRLSRPEILKLSWLEILQLSCMAGNPPAGLVAQSVMSATDMLGHQDVRGLSATDPRLRQWICVCTIPKEVGIPS